MIPYLLEPINYSEEYLEIYYFVEVFFYPRVFQPEQPHF